MVHIDVSQLKLVQANFSGRNKTKTACSNYESGMSQRLSITVLYKQKSISNQHSNSTTIQNEMRFCEHQDYGPHLRFDRSIE